MLLIKRKNNIYIWMQFNIFDALFELILFKYFNIYDIIILFLIANNEK